MTKDKRFLWTCTETLYSNTPDGGTGLLTEPCIVSVYGEKGERGEKYLGHYTDSQTAYEDNTPDLFSGDYYLNTKDSYIYVYIEDTNAWGKITDFDDYRYNQSINDIFEAIESSTQKENFIRAKKIWVQNIAAAVARTETLFSNKITLTQGTDLDGKSAGGIIQSANYASGKSGWKIGYDGNAEFNNATVRGKIYATEGEFKGAITGGTIKIGENFSVSEDGVITAKGGEFENISILKNSFFYGDILTGPIESNSRNPASPSSVSIYEAGTSTEQLLSDIGTAAAMVPCNGKYGDLGFQYYSLRYTSKANLFMFLYDKDIKNLGSNVFGSLPVYNNGYVTLGKRLQLGFYNENAKTLKLNNLPTSEPDGIGVVWVDSSGYLRVKQ